MGDEESVKLLLENGANPIKKGIFATTPLEIATIEEHEAVVKLLLAASDSSHSMLNGVDEGEQGSSTELERSKSRLESDIGRELRASQEASDNPQPTYAADREFEIHTENPIDVQPAGSPTDIDSNAPHHLQSSSPDSTSLHACKFPDSLLVKWYSESQDETNMFEDVCKYRANAKAHGDESFGWLSGLGKVMMRNPGLNEAFIDPETFFGGGRKREGMVRAIAVDAVDKNGKTPVLSWETALRLFVPSVNLQEEWVTIQGV